MDQATLPRLHWTQGDLYKFLMATFPDYRSEHQQVLDIPRLSTELGISEEGLYKPLRKGKLTANRARAFVSLANQPANIAALSNAGRSAPTVEDFAKFVFG